LNRQVSLTTRLAATALLVGVAAVGCSGHGSPASSLAAGSNPTPQSSQVDQAGASISPSPSGSAADSATPSASDVAINPVATPDPIDSPLNSVNQLLNGINSSLQDSGSGGGE
jgi:hypothetical protein